ncbi:MAG: beta-N-acetylhexosaminidase [Lentisphaeria bacterium]|nr:beta-N-acetylhexosaminidase [Lentisphaeria bacterium]
MKLSCVIPTMLLAATTSIVSADFPATVIPVENTRLNGQLVLVPEVQKLEKTDGCFMMPKNVTVAVPDSESLIVEQLANALKRFDITVSVGDDDTTCRFALSENNTPTHPQGYRLVIEKTSITITARSTDGLFYGAQTLLNMIRNTTKPELDCVVISDWPDFDRRGYFMTIRNMKSSALPAFKKSLDAMASLKLNWLLLSIEEAFPYEPNPLINRPNAFTREEMLDLAEFCRARHIEIAPSMQLWSHARWMTYHPDWESKMTEGGPSSSWSCQICPHSQEANELIAEAVKQQIELFHPKVYFMMTDEIFLGPYGQCPRCKADPDLTATYIKEIKFLEQMVLKHGVRPMVCQDSYDDHHWKYGSAMRKVLDPSEMILWWSYSDHLPDHTMKLFKDFQLVGHSLTGKPYNTQNMLRSIRANGGRDSTMVYWYYSANGQFTNLKTECPDSLGGFVNGLDYMWKYRETPYWKLTYDGTFEMIRRLQAEKSVVPECRNVTSIPLENSVNTELGATGRFPVFDDKALAELKQTLANRPEKFRLLTAPGGKYYAMALTGMPGDKNGRDTISFNVNRSAKAISLLMTGSRPSLNVGEYLSAGVYGKKRWDYAPAATLHIFYEDGEKADVPLRYRYDFTDWNRPYGGFNTSFAVRGVDAQKTHYNFCTVRLPNPRPDAKITKIHFQTNRLDDVSPAILAASLIDADKPCDPVEFKPEAVAERDPAFRDVAVAKPKVHWHVDFTKGNLGDARVITRGKFPANFANFEFIDDPESPAGGKVLKIVLPKADIKQGNGYCRLDIDVPATLPPETGSLYIESKMVGGEGFSHSNFYLVENDDYHHWGSKVRIQKDWTTIRLALQHSRDLASQDEKLRGIDKVVLFRFTFFFHYVNTPAEIRIGRIGYSSESSSPEMEPWNINTEAEPL